MFVYIVFTLLRIPKKQNDLVYQQLVPKRTEEKIG